MVLQYYGLITTRERIELITKTSAWFLIDGMVVEDKTVVFEVFSGLTMLL